MLSPAVAVTQTQDHNNLAVLKAIIDQLQQQANDSKAGVALSPSNHIVLPVIKVGTALPSEPIMKLSARQSRLWNSSQRMIRVTSHRTCTPVIIKTMSGDDLLESFGMYSALHMLTTLDPA